MLNKSKNKRETAGVSAGLLIMLLAAGSLPVSAQKPGNEFSIYGGGGIPAVLSNGVSTAGFGGDIGLGFTAFLGEQAALLVGAGFGFNDVNVKVGSLKTLTPDLVDENGQLYDLQTTLSSYSEAQRTTFLSIPVMLQIQSKHETSYGWYIKKKHAFYVLGGAKLLFWRQTEYESSVAALNNTAYYPKYDNKAATQTFAGLGDFKGNSAAGNFSSGLSVILALEMGMKWHMSENSFLYTGAYLDYGLSDAAKNQRKPLDNYTAAEHLSDLTLLAFEDKVRLITVGVKLRLVLFRMTPSATKWS